MKRLSVSVLLAAVLALAGCAEDAPASRAPGMQLTAPRPPTTTAPAAADPAAGASPSTLPPPLPASMHLVTAKRTGIQFPVDRAWTSLDANGLKNPALRKAFDRAAKLLNLTRQRMRLMMAQVDLLVLSPSGDANVNVVPAPGGSLPSVESLRAQFSSLRATITGVRNVATSLGAGEIVTYHLVFSPTITVYGQGLFVPAGSGNVNLTVSARSDVQAHALMTAILPQLRLVRTGV